MRPAATLAAGLLLVVTSGCGTSGDTTLRVLAAASLTDAFTTLADDFEATHPGVDVALSFASSTSLAEQAADGAPGDVLATADPVAMRQAEDAGAVDDPRLLAVNELVLVTRPDAEEVTALEDLAGTTWVRCADSVPCGRAARTLLTDAAVTDRPASLEEDVRAALEKVTSGEADAALVYLTDARAAGEQVAAFPIPGSKAVANDYLIAPLAQAQHEDRARTFVDFALGTHGQAVLRDAGFETP